MSNTPSIPLAHALCEAAIPALAKDYSEAIDVLIGLLPQYEALDVGRDHDAFRQFFADHWDSAERRMKTGERVLMNAMQAQNLELVTVNGRTFVNTCRGVGHQLADADCAPTYVLVYEAAQKAGETL